MKIAGSGEDGVGQEHCLNRTAKLVLAASGSVNKLSVPPKLESPEGKSKLYSMHTAQQTSPQVCVLQGNPQTALVLNMTPLISFLDSSRLVLNFYFSLNPSIVFVTHLALFSSSTVCVHFTFACSSWSTFLPV